MTLPNSYSDDISLPPVNSNLTEIGDTLLNAIRTAIFAIEENIGLNGQGNLSSIAERLGISIDDNGLVRPSALAGIGLVYLPITNAEISATANIDESKLNLYHSTTNLFDLITELDNAVDILNGFVSVTGVKVEPHIAGTGFRHELSHIDVSHSTGLRPLFKTRHDVQRDNTNLYTLINDINNELVAHEKADSTTFPVSDATNPIYGTLPPGDEWAHNSSGIYLNTSNFAFVPQTATDLQQFAQFIDNSNIFLLGNKIQTLFANGVPRTARSGTLQNQNLGQSLISSTSVLTYLLHVSSTAPVDDIDFGDDILEFKPADGYVSSSSFDAQFYTVSVGDVVTVDYGPFVIPHIIKEKKIVVSGSDKRYVVRLNSKNVLAGSFTATVNKPLFSTAKSGVLALAQCPSPTSSLPSLIAGQPRGASVIGVAFNASSINQAHYNLYLALYPTGNPLEQVVTLPAIDVTGNFGVTPGQYTLDSIVASCNASFRTASFNYRFITYQYNGNFGLMLAEPYGNASFSIISGVIGTSEIYDSAATLSVYPQNIIDVSANSVADPLGLGPLNGNSASPPFTASFANKDEAKTPTKIFVPLTRNNFFVNGTERERFAIETDQVLDGYGDSYWASVILSKTIVPGVRTEVTYRISADLSTSSLEVGKTLVAQADGYDNDNAGRFIIKAVTFTNCPGFDGTTDITVYDAVHGTGDHGSDTLDVGAVVNLYFNSDSISFNKENSSDWSAPSINFKRYFEIFFNEDGYSFSHERARLPIHNSNVTINDASLLISGATANQINLLQVSSKLRGYSYGSVSKINVTIETWNAVSGTFTAYLCDRHTSSPLVRNRGIIANGRVGETVRLYDQNGLDFIDISISPLATISSGCWSDVQLFPTLSLDDEVMLIGTVQLNGAENDLEFLRDARQFGNTSEKHLTTSALDYITAPQRLLDENGIIRGFDNIAVGTSSTFYTLTMDGGAALVNGKLVQVENKTIEIPNGFEDLSFYIDEPPDVGLVSWFICINDKSEFELIANTDYVPDEDGNFEGVSLPYDRIFHLRNFGDSEGSGYPVRSGIFQDIILNKKDVTIIGSLDVNIDGAPSFTDATYTDLRRFIAGGYQGLSAPFTWSANGNFRTTNVMCSWIDRLTNYKSFAVNPFVAFSKDVIVSGTFDLAGQKLSYFNFTGSSAIITLGDGAGLSSSSFDHMNFITTNSNISITIDNCKFDTCLIEENNTLTNLSVTNSSFDTSAILFEGLELSGTQNFTNCVFNNCDLHQNQYSVNLIGTSLATGSKFGLVTLTNCTQASLIKCDISFSTTLSTATNVLIDNCLLASDTSAQGIITLSNSTNITISNSTINSNITQAYVFILGTSSTTIDNLTISNCNINYANSFSGVNFNLFYNSSTSKSVSRASIAGVTKTDGGCIYFDPTGSFENITIENNSFNFNGNHFPGIYYLHNNSGSTFENISIDNNKFISSLGQDDRFAAIAIAANYGTVSALGPRVKNVFITNNSLEGQTIIFSSIIGDTGANGSLTNLLVPVNIHIENNLCGAICFMGKQDLVDESSEIVDAGFHIKGNTCKYIYNGLANGYRNFLWNTVQNYGYEATATAIYSPITYVDDNICSWIQLSMKIPSSYAGTSPTLNISGNDIRAYNSSYLNIYHDTVSPLNIGLLVKRIVGA